MKKQITMFLAVAMAAGMMAGCSGGKAQTNASGTAAVSDTAAPETLSLIHICSAARSKGTEPESVVMPPGAKELGRNRL